MATVKETREIFEQKGLKIKLPIQNDFLIKSIDIVERETHIGGSIHYLLKIKYMDDKGRETDELFSCEGRIKRNKPLIATSEEVPKPSILKPMPMRGKIAFESEEEALDYIQQAIAHLLKDKGFGMVEQSGCDLYFQKESRGFFVNLSPRCNDVTLERAEELIELRGRYGSAHDYGLVVLAFQESLGTSLLIQENWFRHHGEFLATHRIGVYGVNNSDPNLIFPFTIYPREREIARYFMFTGPQWSILRNKYVASRKRGAV